MRWPRRCGDVGELAGTVHVWSASLDVSADRLAILENALSPEERAQAARYRTALLTARYVAARGTLREILAAYLRLPPRELVLAYDENRRPLLDTSAHPHAPQFNVTHADGLALFAVTATRRIGVDVERVAPFANMLDVAKGFFSAAERASLTSVEPERVADTFFSIWTRKEAYLKANGMGLLAPLDAFDVSVGRDVPAKLLRVANDAHEVSRWWMAHLEPVDGFIGALAVEGKPIAAHCWTWSA